MNRIRFTAQDLEIFSSASYDRNPLHLSEEYARRTPYGGRVVFGVLNGLTAMGMVPERSGQVLATVEFDFFDTALLGIDYSVQIQQNSDREVAVQVLDGRRSVLEAMLSFRAGAPGRWNSGIARPAVTEARGATSAELGPGYRSGGKYGAPEPEFLPLLTKLGLTKSWIAPQHIAALMWASYLIGMEMPGKRALFSRLRIDFEDAVQVRAPFEYEAEITAVSPVGELSIEGTLSSGGKAWAQVELAAHVREDVPPITMQSVEEFSGRGESLKGKVALVTGASRGLGAALVHALALHGCTVILNFAHNRGMAEHVRDSLAGAVGKVMLEQGDAGNPDWCEEALARIESQVGRLDVLICNASPPLLPLWLEPPGARRVNAFIDSSIAMVGFPLMTFLPQLALRKGWNVLISSVAATQPHPHFPHYAVAKTAAEALVRSAATEYRNISSLIVRPARLVTDLTNTPMGRRGAMAPELVASAIVKRLVGPPSSGKVEVLERFEVMNQGNV